MQNVLRVLLTFALIFSSCTQVRNIKNSREPESFYSKVTKAAYGKTVTITSTSGESYEGIHLKVSSDSTRWVLESSGERVILPTNQIHVVRIKDHFKGSVGGFLIGIPAGLGALFIAWALELKLPETEDTFAAAYILSALTISALVGAGIGAAMGHKDEYIMNPLKE